MELEILTPDKKVFEGTVNSVIVPGVMGSFQILRDHAPIISALEDGAVVIRGNGTEDTFNIRGGVVEVLKNKIIVLTEGVI